LIPLSIGSSEASHAIQNGLSERASHGFDLHGHLDIEVVRFLVEPDLGHPVSLEVEMFIAPRRREGGNAAAVGLTALAVNSDNECDVGLGSAYVKA
jgi:hypothetical protein